MKIVWVCVYMYTFTAVVNTFVLEYWSIRLFTVLEAEKAHTFNPPTLKCLSKSPGMIKMETLTCVLFACAFSHSVHQGRWELQLAQYWHQEALLWWGPFSLAASPHGQSSADVYTPPACSSNALQGSNIIMSMLPLRKTKVMRQTLNFKLRAFSEMTWKS